MVINTNIIINGSNVDSFSTCNIVKSLSNEYSSNEFGVVIDNYMGRNGSKFDIGNSASVFIEKDYNIMKEDIRNKLIGYWKLDENLTWISNLGIEYSQLNDVKDSKGNFNDADNYYTFVEMFDSKINNCLGFHINEDSQVHVVVDPTNPIQNPTDFSISCWLKFDDTTVQDSFYPISALYTSGGNTYRNWALYKGSVPDNNVSFYTYGNGSTAGTFIGSVGAVADSWNYFTGTLTGSLAKFYYNGSLIGSKTPVTRSSLVDTMYFGTGSVYVGVDGYYWIDEIGLFNEEITSTDIHNIYNNGSGLCYGKNIFNGLVEDIKFTGEGIVEKIQMNGRDWTLALQDRTVEPEVYTNTTAGSIVRDIILKYTDGITTKGVKDNPKIIDRIAFNHTPVFDAIKQMADYTQFVYYVDENKDLKFHERKAVNSDYVYNNEAGNVSTKVSFKDQRDTLYNQIWVYGDRYLDGFKETFIADGGSVFTLLYNPHNTNITVGGSVIQPGQIQGINIVPISGAKYEVDYDDKTITFISGTNLGNYTPTSGNSVIVSYERSLPIVKVGDNQSSINTYGKRVKVIQDKNIKDPATAELIMLQNLDDYSDPLKQGTINLKGLDDVNVGQSVLVNNTFYNIVWQSYDIAEIDYSLNSNTCLSEEVMTLKLNKKLPDITDKLKEVILELKKLQGTDISVSDVITRYQFNTGSVGIRTSGLIVYTSSVTGSAYHLYGTTFVPPINPFIISGTTGFGRLSGSPVGSAFGPFVINYSGGYL